MKKVESRMNAKTQEAILRHLQRKLAILAERAFCARMKGMKRKLTSKKTASDPDSRINKSLRAWNC